MKREKLSAIRSRVGVGVLLILTLCFLWGRGHLEFFALSQPGPWLVRLSAGFSVSAAAFLTLFALFAFLFGRFFCAAFCPLGVLQDIAGRLLKNKKASALNLRSLRYVVAAASILLLASGWSLIFKLFDPFSRFGGILSGLSGTVSPLRNDAGAGAFILGGLLPLLVLIALVRRQERLYCTALCPIGTMLGLLAKHGIWQMRMSDSCVGCEICEGRCPSGCIESKTRSIDNERCVRCLNCLSLCAKGGVSLSRKKSREAPEEISVDRGRRAFLIKGAAAALGILTTGHILGGPARSFARSGKRAEGLIHPPGAMDAGDFMSKCTSCHLCVMSCPSNVIKPSMYGFGAVHLEYDAGACLYDCTRCNHICPAGALKPLPLKDKQWLKIGEAAFDESRCMVVKDKKPCELCFHACPKGAIHMADAPNDLKIPEVLTFHCIGCGACQEACPATPKALTVIGVDQGKFARIS